MPVRRAGAEDGAMPRPPRVLLVVANFAVGLAVCRRLAGLAVVQTADGRDAGGRLPELDPFDAVILCPYVDAGRCAEIRARLAPLAPPPLLVTLVDAATGWAV